MPVPFAERSSEDFRQPGAGAVLRSLAPSLLINGVLPIVLYQVLPAGVATIPALVAGSVFPIAYTAWGWACTRSLDLIAAISLFFIVVGALSSLVSGSTRFTLIKELFFTGLFGLVFFGSLLAPRPLMFYVARQFATGGVPERVRRWDDLWQYPGFRHPMRVMTAMWGTTFVADALIRVALVFILSTSVFLVASQAALLRDVCADDVRDHCVRSSRSTPVAGPARCPGTPRPPPEERPVSEALRPRRQRAAGVAGVDHVPRLDEQHVRLDVGLRAVLLTTRHHEQLTGVENDVIAVAHPDGEAAGSGQGTAHPSLRGCAM